MNAKGKYIILEKIPETEQKVGNIVLPAHSANDTFLAKVLSVGKEAKEASIKDGDIVVVINNSYFGYDNKLIVTYHDILAEAN